MSKTNQTLKKIIESVYSAGFEVGQYTQPSDETLEQRLDQALKEISELLLDCKPEKPIYDNRRSPKTTGKTHGTKDFVIGYSAGVDDYEKNIKEVLK